VPWSRVHSDKTHKGNTHNEPKKTAHTGSPTPNTTCNQKRYAFGPPLAGVELQRNHGASPLYSTVQITCIYSNEGRLLDTLTISRRPDRPTQTQNRERNQPKTLSPKRTAVPRLPSPRGQLRHAHNPCVVALKDMDLIYRSARLPQLRRRSRLAYASPSWAHLSL